MLDPNAQLTIKYSDNGSFSDYSQDFQDFTRDVQALDIVAAEDKLYVGYYKPINKLYIDFNSPNTATNVCTLKYFNGSAFVDVAGQIDETKGLTRSGFMQWTREQADQAATSVDGVELYWYELTVSVDTVDMVVNAIGLIFADDKDLAEQIPNINDSAHLAGKPSHILAHVSTAKWMIQDLRNKNYGKRDADGNFQDITVWDLLDIDQINQAATLKALATIFFNYSDEPNDIYEKKSKAYESAYKSAMSLATLRLDVNDDGHKDITENTAEYHTRRFTR